MQPEIIDIEILKRFVADEIDYDKEFALKLFRTFKKYIDQLIEFKFNGDGHRLKEIEDMAHRLRSSCATFGAKSLEEQLEQLEDKAASGNIGEVRKRIGEAQALAKLTVDALQSNLESGIDWG